MTQTPPPATSLPHHKLFAYELCLSLVKLVAKTRVADAQLRAQARKSAASAALNCAEGAARQTRADKSRAYAIALCECCEACAAIEIAGALWCVFGGRCSGGSCARHPHQKHPQPSRALRARRFALFRSVAQRLDKRRATPWQPLMTDLFVDPNPIACIQAHGAGCSAGQRRHWRVEIQACKRRSSIP